MLIDIAALCPSCFGLRDIEVLVKYLPPTYILAYACNGEGYQLRLTQVSEICKKVTRKPLHLAKSFNPTYVLILFNDIL